MPIDLSSAIRWNGANYNEIYKVFKSLDLDTIDSSFTYTLSQTEDNLVLSRNYVGWGVHHSGKYSHLYSVDIGGWFLPPTTKAGHWFLYLVITNKKYNQIKNRITDIKVLNTLTLINDNSSTQEELDFFNSEEQKKVRNKEFEDEQNKVKESLMFLPTDYY